MAKFADKMDKIAEGVTEGYQKIEDGVVGGYKKIEDKFTDAFLNEDGALKTGKVGETVTGCYKKVEGAFVGGFNKIADKFVDTFLAKEGESVEDAKERVAAEQKSREEQMEADMASYPWLLTRFLTQRAKVKPFHKIIQLFFSELPTLYQWCT